MAFAEDEAAPAVAAHAVEPTERGLGDETRARDGLLDLINAGWSTQVIRAACALNLPDKLAAGPRTAIELAGDDLHAPSLRRLLHALLTLDVCCQPAADTFGLTPRGGLLRAEAPGSLRAWALLTGGPIMQRAAELEQTVRTGVSHRTRHAGSEDFAHLDADRVAAALFNRAMTDLTRHVGELVARRVDVSTARRIVDVGGGTGALLATLLPRCPSARGVLFDLAHAIDAPDTPDAPLRAAGVADRCERIAGSFFDGVPAGGDVYLLKSVLHNWDDARCEQILAHCRAAMAAGACTLVIERVMAEQPGTTARDRATARSDLNMLLALSGRERTEAAFRALFAATGLELTRVVPTGGEFVVLEARAVRR